VVKIVGKSWVLGVGNVCRAPAFWGYTKGESGTAGLGRAQGKRGFWALAQSESLAKHFVKQVQGGKVFDQLFGRGAGGAEIQGQWILARNCLPALVGFGQPWFSWSEGVLHPPALGELLAG
jgi:hypothetical protein